MSLSLRNLLPGLWAWTGQRSLLPLPYLFLPTLSTQMESLLRADLVSNSAKPVNPQFELTNHISSLWRIPESLAVPERRGHSLLPYPQSSSMMGPATSGHPAIGLS
jgi:hypothetical protein